MTIEAANIGHNHPPTDMEILQDRLEGTYPELLSRKQELLDSLERVPLEVEDEETAGRIADYIKQLKAAAKNADKCRVAEKEPHLEAGRAVDGFFRAIADPLTDAAKKVNQRLTIYQQKIMAEERRRREEQERLAREAAEKAAAEAAEAEARASDERGLESAIEADETARQRENDAARAAREANANAADLSRQRSDFGTVSSLQTFWNFQSLDRDQLDLEALRHHLPQDALEKAVRSYIKAGGRELTGVSIFEDSKSVVR